jgi:5-formyltetrahydrofolate cyclo-ligase
MSRDLPIPKDEIRQMVWRILETRGASRFPAAKDRIPNFVGAERAALHLRTLPAWRQARVVTINADPPQLAVRRLALRDGKVVYVPATRRPTLDGFFELDPARLGPCALQAASIRGAERLAPTVLVEAVPAMDLVVVGAVAVNARGARVGSGRGCSDLTYGLLAETGKVGADTPIITTVHGLQVLARALPMQPHDVPVDVAVTPEGPLRFTRTYLRPRGIDPGLVSPEHGARRVLGRLPASH